MQDLHTLAQIQHRTHVLDHADYTAPIRQHELDHAYQESICPAWQIWIMNCTDVVGINDLSNVYNNIVTTCLPADYGQGWTYVCVDRKK